MYIWLTKAVMLILVKGNPWSHIISFENTTRESAYSDKISYNT